MEKSLVCWGERASSQSSSAGFTKLRVRPKTNSMLQKSSTGGSRNYFCIPQNPTNFTDCTGCDRPSWTGGVAAAKPQTGWLFNHHFDFPIVFGRILLRKIVNLYSDLEQPPRARLFLMSHPSCPGGGDCGLRDCKASEG